MSDPLPSPEEIRAAFSPSQAELLLRLLLREKVPAPPPPLLKLEEAAAKLDKSKSWLYHNYRGLGLGFKKIGGELRFRGADVERFLRVGGRRRA